MALGDGTAWDETTPTNATNLSDGDDHILDIRKGVRIRLEYEHSTLAGSSAGGKHKFMTMQTQAVKPTVDATQTAALYVKDVGSGIIELFYEDEAGNELQITNGTQVNNTLPTHYRDGCRVQKAGSATTITVNKGFLDVNGSNVSIAATTLTLTTNGDWASGSSEQAVSTFGYVGVSAAGAIKMDTTAPTHDNYGVSTTVGLKRYVTWHGTVYRVIGWFKMNATGSGELDSYSVSNIREGDAVNHVHRVGSTDDTINDTSYGSDLTECTVPFYATGRRPVVVVCKLHNNNDGALGINNGMTAIVDLDGSDDSDSESATTSDAAGSISHTLTLHYIKTDVTEGSHTFTIQAKVEAGADMVTHKVLDVYEL